MADRSDQSAHVSHAGSSEERSDSEPEGQVGSEAGSDDFQVISVSDAISTRGETTCKGDLDGATGVGFEEFAEKNAGLAGRALASTEVRKSETLLASADKEGQSDTPPAVGIGSAKLANWVQSAIAMQEKSGATFTQVLRKNKNFRNPAIFEKMISYCGIDDRMSHLPSQLHLEPTDYYEAIAELQEYCTKEKLL